MAEQQSPGASRRRFLQGLAAAAAAAGAVGANPSDADASTMRVTSRRRAAGTAHGQVTGDRSRLDEVWQLRMRAAEMCTAIDPPEHVANDDELAETGYAMSFTKGLAHDHETGLVRRPEHYERFVAAIEAGHAGGFADVPFGPFGGPTRGFRTVEADPEPRLRGWETPGAGHCFTLSGHDPQSLTMPPAPAAGSSELIGEIAEVYAMAALRDVPLTVLRHDASANGQRDRVLDGLDRLPWFSDRAAVSTTAPGAAARRRTGLTPQTVFRGLAPGDDVGPYLSQLLLLGSSTGARQAYEGRIDYGAQTIDQRVRQVAPVDFMTSWDEWFDVNNALRPATAEPDTGNRRFITTGRDLSTYVHSDALNQAYVNACLVLLTNGVELDRALPYRRDDADDHQQGFVVYAMQHVLSLLGEVSDRALRTVWFQKYNVHRRLRPEALAARIEKSDLLDLAPITRMARQLDANPISEEIRRITRTASGTESMLLPMAFVEGSPMHPSYGAGHATLAGACVTVLKAFFDHSHTFDIDGDASIAYVPTTDGSRLAFVDVFDAAGRPATITVEGELNKLAANVSIGRSWAGVHYYSDYWESVLLGEQVAIELLREHMLAMPDQPRLVLPRFDGTHMVL